MKTIAATQRLDYLDAVRAFALLLGIVFHASLSFMPMYIGWAVMDVSTSSIIPAFLLISHSFRMELFFLIAGFFSHMTFHRKGPTSFLQSRLLRIAVPLALGWFILRPLLVSAWVMGTESMQGDVNIIPALKTGFATLGDLPKDLFIGTHLWFLYYLLLLTGATLLLRFLFSSNMRLKEASCRFADTCTRWLSRSHLALIVLAIPTAACVWFMSHWGMDTPDKSLVPNLPVSLVYGGFFLFGWLLHRQKQLIESFARLSWSKFALCLLAIAAALFLSSFERQFGHEHYNLIKASFMFSYALMMWTLVSLSIGLFKRYLDRPSKTVRYIADSSYWLYLIHLPVVIWLQIAFAELPFHWSIKLAAISLLTIGLSILLYDLFVRSTFIGAVLNGKRKPRLLSQFSKSPQKQPVASGEAIR